MNAAVRRGHDRASGLFAAYFTRQESYQSPFVLLRQSKRASRSAWLDHHETSPIGTRQVAYGE